MPVFPSFDSQLSKERYALLEGLTPPWGERPSIYEHIRAHLRPEPGLTESGNTLPDETLVQERERERLAPGERDARLFLYDEEEDPDTAALVLEQLRALVQSPTAENAAALYATLAGARMLTYINPVFDALFNASQAESRNVFMLEAVGRWLATRAADREAVKFGMELMLSRGHSEREILLTLGRHEEFTLFVVDNRSFTRTRLLSLARLVSGWGRVCFVEEIARSYTTDEETQAWLLREGGGWLLREGYRNDIGYEHTALNCARAGGLLEALRLPDPDDALLHGAGDILLTLIRDWVYLAAGEYRPRIGWYTDGAEATLLYLGHLRARAELALEHLLQVKRIQEFLKDENSVAHDESLGWVERRGELLEHIRAILQRPEWESKVRAQLESAEPDVVREAVGIAEALGLDAWEHYFTRAERGEEDWWWLLMQAKDAARIARVVALVEARLPLKEIATGPANKLGLGAEDRAHRALGYILQDLPSFPGIGWPLIRAGLRSPVTRNRNLAAQALAAWPRKTWPPDAEAMLRRACKEEPDQYTAADIRAVLAGEPWDYLGYVKIPDIDGWAMSSHKLLLEVWEHLQDGQWLPSLLTAGPRGEGARRLFRQDSDDARLVGTIWAGSHFEAMTIYEGLLGRGKYSTHEPSAFEPYPVAWLLEQRRAGITTR
jgi:hypothetical protein